ncbi:MAG: T9SS type A sorting domain-containing protein, partial [Bacteroidota bacterium]
VLLTETGTLNPYSLRTFEIISGTWGTYRNATSEDPYIRSVITLDSAVFTSVEGQIDLVENFQVFPNPTAGELNILIETERPTDMELKIYNLQGQKVMREVNRNISRVDRKIDLSSLTAGVYFVHLTTPEGTQIAKIVLQ